VIRRLRIEQLGFIPDTTEDPKHVARWLIAANPGGSPKWWAEVFARLRAEIGDADRPAAD